MRVLLSAIFVCGLIVSACGSNESQAPASGPAGVFSSGLPGNQTINSLTPAQAKQFCDNAQRWGSSSTYQSQGVEMKCRVEGSLAVAGPAMAGGTGSASGTAPAAIPAGSEPATCKAAYDSCKQKEAQGAGLIASLTGNCKATPDCAATVAEVEACFNSLQGNIDSLDKSIPSCDGMTAKIASDSLMSLLTFYSQMASGQCGPVTTKCASMNPLASITSPSSSR